MGYQLPDSGGAYGDEVQTGAVSGLVSRTWRDAKRTVVSGEVGGKAVSIALGGALAATIAGFVGFNYGQN